MSLRHDLRFSARSLLRSPSFTLIATLSLGLVIGTATAIFTAVDGLLLTTYPYASPERLYVTKALNDSGASFRLVISARSFTELLKADSVEDGIMWDQFPMTAQHGTEAVAVGGAKVSANTFRVLGVPALLGRTFSGDFDEVFAPAPQVVVLGYRYWLARFAGASDVLGQTLVLDRQPHTIIGVMPERFRFLNADLYVPLPHADSPSVSLVRLKEGVSVAAAATELEAIDSRRRQRTATEFPYRRLELASHRDEETGHLTRLLGTLSGAGALLLAIACINTSILLLARGARRTRELTTRIALGASTSRLLRQLLIDALVLALLAGVTGLTVGAVVLGIMLAFVPRGLIPGEIIVSMGPRTLLFVVGTTLVAGLASGILPALRLSRAHTLNERLSPAAGVPRLHALLVPVQLTLTILLLAGSAAALRTFVDLRSTLLGYEPGNVRTLAIALSEGELPGWAERTAYFERLRAAVADVPGVESVSITDRSLPPQVNDRTTFSIRGLDVPDGTYVATQIVDDHYFGALRIPLLRGRLWSSAETQRGSRVAVISDTMAQRYWPGTDPIGARMYMGSLRHFSPYQVDSPGNDGWVEVIGVVGNVRNVGLAAEPLPAIYTPYTVLPWDSIRLLVRTNAAGAPSTQELVAAISSASSTQAVWEVSSLQERVRQSGWARQEFVAMLFLGFAICALVLAVVGLYAVVANAVSQRTREFAVRRAVGATSAHLTAQVASSVGLSLFAGIVLGILTTALFDEPISAWTESRLWDATALARIVVLVIAASVLALALPARRAATIDPMIVLRGDS